VEHASAVEIYPGVWLTGPVTRRYPERNWSGLGRLVLENGKTAEDNVPEDMSLVIDTDRGLVLISGCGHAGIVNTMEQARSTVRQAPFYAAIGGFHLFPASDDTLKWTAGKLHEFGLQNLLGAHCTGIEAVYRLRELLGLPRGTANVGAVGGGFRLDTGLQPGAIAK
jgi:7,8-dihydropterin-6-yl-methyl-4-(beta-D-ribofuranosyl)aminobenzene 5'-phosphate synthase